MFPLWIYSPKFVYISFIALGQSMTYLFILTNEFTVFLIVNFSIFFGLKINREQQMWYRVTLDDENNHKFQGNPKCYIIDGMRVFFFFFKEQCDIATYQS